MVVIKIQGGLGNQLFQWAFGKNISLKFNKNFFIDASFYNAKSSVVRDFSLDKFKFGISHLTNKDVEMFRSKSISTISDPINFKEIILSDNINYYLDGYWQSDKFFMEYETEILKDFYYSSDKIEKIATEIDFENNLTISLHVRRGDYVDAHDMYPLQSIEYYKNALDQIGKYDKLLIFSDDISWCEDNFNFDNMIFSRGFDNVEDVTLMSKCHHNIIANSSFSWWGAYLNKNVNKKVIAPSLWYGPKMNIETKDLIPDSWIKI